MLDKQLSFSEHVTGVVAKVNRLLGLIKQCFQHMDAYLLRLLFTSIVRPHLEYGNVVWHPHFKCNIALLERVQHRATRLMPELRRLPYEERLERLQLPSLEYRRLRGDIIEVYKYPHGLYSADGGSLLPLADLKYVATRGHDYKLRKEFMDHTQK